MSECSGRGVRCTPLLGKCFPSGSGGRQRTFMPGAYTLNLTLARVIRLEDMPEGSAEANLAAFDSALAQAARALRVHGFLPSTAAAGGSDAPTLALSSSAGSLQASVQLLFDAHIM